jgi:hypothetical protein
MRYTVISTDMCHSPGLYRYAMACAKGTWNSEAMDVAARMYLLADLFHTAPAGLVKKIAQGDADITVDDDAGTVTVTLPEEE